MTSKDKTGDKLVASMRKSKTGNVASKTAAPPVADAADKPRADPAVSGPVAGAAKQREQRKTTSQDSYTVGQRVWPD